VRLKSVLDLSDTASFLGISIVGQSNKAGDGGIYVGSIMKGFVFLHVINLFLYRVVCEAESKYKMSKKSIRKS